MGSFTKFNTREGANRGMEMPVLGLDGKQSGETIVVHGKDSDVFQQANGRMRSAVLDYLDDKGLATRGTEEYIRMTQEQQLLLQASLVISWSFEEECNQENITKLFRDAPYIADQ